MIEVGDYARIDKDFRTICIGIGKVVNKSQDIIYVKMSNNDLPISFNEDSIAKHSKELIDLIEAGDYVNGHKVYEVVKDTLISYVVLEGVGSYIDTLEEIIEKDIKTILTKEQYEANCYKVKEE